MFKNLIDWERLIHSIKTLVAVLIGFLLAKLIGFPADQWIIITIVIVMCAQIYVGSVVQKAYLRFLGTLIGCLFATITLLALGDSNLAIGIAICLSSFIFSYVATGREELSYACTLGAVTTIIIMLGQKPTILIAGLRFMEISIGLLIAALISQFLFPIHARQHLRSAQAKALTLLRNHYHACMMSNEVERETIHFEEFDENIVKTLSKQRQLAKEAAREPLGEMFSSKIFVKSLHAEKEILRSIDFMHHALISIHKISPKILETDALIAFHKSVIQVLTLLIVSQETNKPSSLLIQLPEINALKKEINRQNTQNEEELLCLYGFLFAAETLVDSLRKLAILYRVSLT